jgi:NAD(P)-dependent dehydrogenase (short-subunit alcohol dehydrogenase family)
LRKVEHFNNKIVIVTGGASGIGQALCRELGRRGAVVVVADINAEGAERVALDIAAGGGQARAAQVDVTRYEDVQGVVDRTVSHNGQLDFMFNNAGATICGEVRDMELAH